MSQQLGDLEEGLKDKKSVLEIFSSMTSLIGSFLSILLVILIVYWAIKIPEKNVNDLPIINAIVKPHTKLSDWAGKSVVGFSGIAHPEKFRVTLDNLNCKVVSFENFPDHYPYKKGDIEKLKTKAKNFNANLVTTEKDFIRIPSSQQENILTIPIQIVFENKTILKKIIQETLQKDSDIKKIIPNLSR